MPRLSLSTKITGLAVGTILVTALFLGVLSVHELRRQAEDRIASYREEALVRHTERVKNLVEVAYTDAENHYRMWAEAAPGSPWHGRPEPDIQEYMLANLRNLRYGDDNYFWVNDLYGQMLMHPYQAHLEGTNVTNMQDTNGIYLFREMGRVCLEHGQGLVAYTWPRPGTDRPEPKLSFVKLFRPWNWIIGSGVYVGDIDAVVAAERARVDAQVRQEILRIVGIAVALAACFILLVALACRRFVTTPLRRARDLVRRLPAGDLDLVERLPEVPADEVGELQAAINAMVGAWQRVGVEIRERRRFAEELIRSSAVASFVLGPDHRVLMWNRACEQLTGLPAAAMVDSRDQWRAFYPEPTPTLADMVIDGAFGQAEGRYLHFQTSHLAREGKHAELWSDELGGRRRYVIFDAVPIRDPDGRLVAVLQTMQDMTELKDTEEKLARLATAVEHAAEAIVVTDAHGQITYTNPGFAALTGYDHAETRNSNIYLLRSRQYGGRHYEEMEAALQRGDSWSGRLVNRRKDGTFFDEEVSVAPVYADDGELAGYVSVQRDISRERAMEKQLRQAQKLEAAGTISGGIAHEFNSLLNAIIGFAELTLDGCSRPEETRKYMEQVLSAADRGRALVEQMAAFSRQLDTDREELPIAELLDEAREAVCPRLPAGFEVRLCPVPEGASAWGDRRQLVGVLANLLTNATQAMSGLTGTVEVSVDSLVVGGETPTGALPPGAYWRVSLCDDGVGMSPEVMERIFDPFFTTRDVGEGKGLGLSVVHGAIKGVGGAVTVDSSPGEGATFHLYFPRCDPEPAPAVPVGNSERILVVTHNVHDAEGLGQLLQLLGYRPTVATDSAEALATARFCPEGFDLALVENHTASTGWLELAGELHRQVPGIRVILCGGDDSSGPPAADTDNGIAGRLHSPYSPETLAAVVGAALHSPRPA